MINTTQDFIRDNALSPGDIVETFKLFDVPYVSYDLQITAKGFEPSTEGWKKFVNNHAVPQLRAFIRLYTTEFNKSNKNTNSSDYSRKIRLKVLTWPIRAREDFYILAGMSAKGIGLWERGVPTGMTRVIASNIKDRILFPVKT